MTDNDKNYGENSVLRVRLPMKASELERIIRVHCEHHGVWDDCIVKSEEDGNVETSYIREYADRIEAAHMREIRSKYSENNRLRALVKELTDRLHSGNYCGTVFGECKITDICRNAGTCALIAMAKEAAE